LHREVGGFLAFQNAVNVAGSATVLVDLIRPIGDQAADNRKVAIRVHRRQLMPGRKRDN
jgi:hypothetical protein